MPERYLHSLTLEDAAGEDIAATRERLKTRFARGATRRMTQLGMLVGASLQEIELQEDDALVYLSAYAESRALEGYLDSFPCASPTLFQTSIHPSAVQQALIGRQQAIGEFLPLTGRRHLVGQALQAAVLSPQPRVILCGGEERGTWLLDHAMASDCSFAFAFALAVEPVGAVAQLQVDHDDATEAPAFTLPQFFELLRARSAIDRIVAPGIRLALSWI